MAAESIVLGLADRLRNLLLALDRQDRLESAGVFVGWLQRRQGDPERLASPAREMLLRALRLVADPTNLELLRRLDPVDAIEFAALQEASGLGRVALSERLHDLVQGGLASRELVGDQVRSTPLATGLVDWIDLVAARTGVVLAEQLGGAAKGKGAGADG